jgi:hypothetical protein
MSPSTRMLPEGSMLDNSQSQQKLARFNQTQQKMALKRPCSVRDRTSATEGRTDVVRSHRQCVLHDALRNLAVIVHCGAALPRRWQRL